MKPTNLIRELLNLVGVKTVALFIVVAQGSGLYLAPQNWGLDGSWNWLAIESARNKLYGQGSFFWTHGPFYFLDTQQVFWQLGLILAIVYRISVYLSLFFILLKSFKNAGLHNNASTWSAVITCTVVSLYATPSHALIFIFLVLMIDIDLRSARLLRLLPYVLGIILAIELYVKTIYAILFFLISIGLLFKGKLNKGDLHKFFLTTALAVFSFALIHGFSWKSFLLLIRANWELTSGYGAMSIEEPSRSWEYLALGILISLVIVCMLKLHLSRIHFFLIILLLAVVSRYGFTRHDGHSSFTFLWISFLSLLIFLRIRNFSLIGLIVIPLAILSIVSNVTFMSMIDIDGRINKSFNYLRALNPSYKIDFQNADKTNIRNIAQIGPLLINKIGEEEVAILPWDQLVGYGYNLNLVSPPVPQPYSAYTEWLDEKNAEFFSGVQKPRLLLLSKPKAIDGRNYWWESPGAQLAIICNYKASYHETDWLLMEARSSSICDFHKSTGTNKNSTSGVKVPHPESKIVLMNFEQEKRTFWDISKIVLKSSTKSKTVLDNQEFVLPRNRNRGLIVHIPTSLNLPDAWSLPKVNYVSNQPKSKISLNYVSVKAKE